MLFGKKEDKSKLPDLPPLKARLPVMPGFEDDMNGPHELPSFPDSPMHNRFSQAAIKDAVSFGEKPVEIPGGVQKVVEMEEWMPSDFKVANKPLPALPFEKFESLRPLPSASMQRVEENVVARPGTGAADVFVKIEKFHSARKTLKDISEKLEEIDSLVKKIRETKLREEQEISGWESDITAVKTRLQEVVDNIFEKVD